MVRGVFHTDYRNRAFVLIAQFFPIALAVRAIDQIPRRGRQDLAGVVRERPDCGRFAKRAVQTTRSGGDLPTPAPQLLEDRTPIRPEFLAIAMEQF